MERVVDRKLCGEDAARQRDVEIGSACRLAQAIASTQKNSSVSSRYPCILHFVLASAVMMTPIFTTSGACRLDAVSEPGEAADSRSPSQLSFELVPAQPRAVAVASGLASLAAGVPGFASDPGPGPGSCAPPNLLCTLAAAPATLKVIRIKGDGKCMFRALALGLARNQGRVLPPPVEQKEADNLRMAVAEALCRTEKRRKQFGRAVRALQQEDTLKSYCKRLASPSFWGGEPEMMVLSDMLKVPIYVYLSESEYGGGQGYSCIQKFGEQYRKGGKGRRPVRLLFTGNNHFDLLVKS